MQLLPTVWKAELSYNLCICWKPFIIAKVLIVLKGFPHKPFLNLSNSAASKYKKGLQLAVAQDGKGESVLEKTRIPPFGVDLSQRSGILQ